LFPLNRFFSIAISHLVTSLTFKSQISHCELCMFYYIL